MLSIYLDWKELNPKLNLYSLQSAHKFALQSMLDHHTQIFEDELGKVKGVTAKIFTSPKATPRFCKLCSVPYTLKSKVDQELESLETAGLIKLVQIAEWAAPIVPILKRDGSIRVCGDYKVIVNMAANEIPIHYPGLRAFFLHLQEECHSRSWIWHMPINRFLLRRVPRNWW